MPPPCFLNAPKPASLRALRVTLPNPNKSGRDKLCYLSGTRCNKSSELASTPCNSVHPSVKLCVIKPASLRALCVTLCLLSGTQCNKSSEPASNNIHLSILSITPSISTLAFQPNFFPAFSGSAFDILKSVGRIRSGD